MGANNWSCKSWNNSNKTEAASSEAEAKNVSLEELILCERYWCLVISLAAKGKGICEALTELQKRKGKERQ